MIMSTVVNVEWNTHQSHNKRHSDLWPAGEKDGSREQIHRVVAGCFAADPYVMKQAEALSYLLGALASEKRVSEVGCRGLPQ